MIKAERFWLFEHDPASFARYVFRRINGGQPDPIQLDFLTTDAQDILLNWCRQSGKTTCAATKTTHGAIFQPNTLGLIISATQRQAGILQRRVTGALRVVNQDGKSWREVRKLYLPEDPLDDNSRIVRCSILSLELGNGSEVVSIPASADTVRGYSPDRIVMDEASRIPDAVFDAVRPMLAIKQVQLIVMSTPNGKRGFFFREWTGDDATWWKSAMDANACPRIKPAFLAREKLKMSSTAMFEQEYYLRFLEPQGSLFTEEQVKAMFVSADRAPVRAIKPALVVPGQAYKIKEDGIERPQRFVPRIGYG